MLTYMKDAIIMPYIMDNFGILHFHLFEPRYEKTVFFCICENKDADQLRGNRKADQRLCFRYTVGTIPVLGLKFCI